jgi:hypothetical protein
VNPGQKKRARTTFAIRTRWARAVGEGLRKPSRCGSPLVAGEGTAGSDPRSLHCYLGDVRGCGRERSIFLRGGLVGGRGGSSSCRPASPSRQRGGIPYSDAGVPDAVPHPRSSEGPRHGRLQTHLKGATGGVRVIELVELRRQLQPHPSRDDDRGPDGVAENRRLTRQRGGRSRPSTRTIPSTPEPRGVSISR